MGINVVVEQPNQRGAWELSNPSEGGFLQSNSARWKSDHAAFHLVDS